MRRKIVDMSVERGRRMIAISDIHAHPELLNALLDKVDYAPADLLVIVGDIIDCGARSLAALRRVMALVDGGAVALAGNWEEFTINLIDSDVPEDNAFAKARWLYLKNGYGSCLFSEMLAEIGMELTPDTDIRAALNAVRARFARELDFMRELPIALDTGDFFFVHAGAPTLDRQKLAQMDDIELLKRDAFMKQGYKFDKWMIVGHWPVTLYSPQKPRVNPVIDRDLRIIGIDGGVGKNPNHQLNSLILRAGQPDLIDFAEASPYPSAIARDNQTGADDDFYINCFSRELELIEDGAELARVRHVASGKILDLPKRFLYRNPEGELCSQDITFNRLEVTAGDELMIIAETPLGLYCKKRGEVGWYCGSVS